MLAWYYYSPGCYLGKTISMKILCNYIEEVHPTICLCGIIEHVRQRISVGAQNNRMGIFFAFSRNSSI